MLHIVDYKLRDSTHMQSILEASGKEEAKNRSLRAFNNVRNAGVAAEHKFNIDAKSCVSAEKWNVEHRVSSPGSRNFSVIVTDINGDCKCIEMRADGHKTAYNNATANLPRDKRNYIVFLYDLTQQGKYKSSLAEAEKMLEDEEKTKETIVNAKNKAKEVESSNNSFVIFEDVKLLCDIVYDYVKGYYTKIPHRTIIAIAAALLYFFSPIDVIPDFLAMFYGVGYLDDVAVVMYTIKALHDDLQEYKEYRVTPEYAQRRKERDKQIAQKKREKEQQKVLKEAQKA